MPNVPSVRLTVPKAAAGEIVRENLISAVLNSSQKLAYIHAGAGYGKTTLLSQIARRAEHAVWLSLDGENDIFTFANTLCEAMRQPFSGFEFTAAEYLPFSEKNNLVTRLADGLICAIEGIPEDFTAVIDDLHTIGDDQVRKLLTRFIKHAPKNMKLCLGSREAPWRDLVPLQLRGSIIELTQKDLAFTRHEASRILGFDDDFIYRTTEGWPLAIGSFKVLLENGVSVADIPERGNEALYSYLFYECLSRLPSDTIAFLKASACFLELDVQMMDAVLNRKNTKIILEDLVSRNIFTIKTGNGHRYHPLFAEYLRTEADASLILTLQNKALRYYFDHGQYYIAAQYAICLNDDEMLQRIITICYKDLLRSGDFGQLRVWFQALDNNRSTLSPEVLLAKGAYLSSVGNFVEAKTCLDALIPLLKEEEGDKDLYIQVMVHKARILRNFVSFEESNKLLDELIVKLDDPASELAYTVVIEKLYNLCWISRINEAYDLALKMIKTCAGAGNLKVKAWYERYLCTIHFFMGNMRETVYFYEKSCDLPERERQYLDMHTIGIYAAKAYQMLGDRDRSLSLISVELQKFKSTGKYEEIWAGYLLAAEIHYQNADTDNRNGGNQSFETTRRFFTLADEYAPLYRKTEFQIQFAKMQRLAYSIMFAKEPQESIIDEIFKNLDQTSAYLKTVVLARMCGYFAALSDLPRAVKCANLCIEVGEEAGMMYLPTASYGILAKCALAANDQSSAATYTKRYLQLCFENGIYEYFRIRKEYDPILEFAYSNGIEPAITTEIMKFAGYNAKKAYIATLGTFSVFHNNDKQESVRLRTRKERELLAFLLDAGDQGVTKEQIYHAIWWESESADVKNLIGVNLAHIKSDLSRTGIKKSVVHRENRYYLCKDEIEYDIDLFEQAYEEFKLQNTREQAKKLLSLYKGEYLSGFEALWATAKRIRYREIYEEAAKYCLYY